MRAPANDSRPLSAGAWWPLPVLFATVLIGVLGVVVLRPAGSGGDGPNTTIGPAAENQPVELCTRASLEERAGLVLVVGLPGVTDAYDPLIDELVDVGVGGVMLRDENITDEEQAQNLVSGLRYRLGQNLLVAVDDEGGRVTSMRALDQSVTSARRLGQRGSEAAREAGRELGDLAASIDIDWVFAPVVDLDDGPASGVIGDRSFGAEPDEVVEAAGAFARGLRSSGMAVTVKHFPGHGGGVGDPHLDAAEDQRTLDDLRARDLVPFQALIGQGAESVMVSHLAFPRVWGELPASLEPRAYELLRTQGFDGVAITDALGMGAVHARWGFDVAPAMAVAAGADAVLVNQGDQVAVLLSGLVTAVEAGRLEEARLDEAVERMLDLRGQRADGIVCPD